jgi:hypothetical protein
MIADDSRESIVARAMLPVQASVSTLPAGAKNRKAIAGPSPTPFFWMPANSGTIVHGHTASSERAAVGEV